MRKVRRALDDDGHLVETVPGRGYRLTATVSIEGTGRDPRTTLAVLPLLNLTGDDDREYVADSLTEELVTTLGQLAPSALGVVGYTASRAYKRSALSLTEIARALAADLVVEGSIRGPASVPRVTVRLLDPRVQTLLWSHAFDAVPSAIDELRERLRRALEPVVSRPLAPAPAPARRQTADPEAFDLYLRGRHHWNQLTPLGTRLALQHFALATERDPGYALAWAGQVDAHASSPITSDAPPSAARCAATEALARAQVAGPDLAEVHVSTGFVEFFLEWRWPAAAHAFESAVERDPSSALAQRMAGVVASHRGDAERARAYLREARRLDPYAMHHALSSMAELHAGDVEAALAFGRQATVLAPNFWIGQYHLAQALVEAQRYDAALEVLSAIPSNGVNSKVLGLRGYALARAGRHDAAREVVDALRGLARERYVPPCATALVELGLGDVGRCLRALDEALAVRDVHLIFLPCDPKWAPLRGNAGFESVVRRCGFGREA
jgi:TolB-like protein/predicted negative regulator of RcsB-dependent stress response